MPRIVVVGAGVAGLAAAIRIRDTRPDLEISVLDRADRVGGLIRTERFDGFVIERGPESIITEKLPAIRMVDRLGLDPHVVRTEPRHRGAFVVTRGRLERIPEGFQLLAPTDFGAFLRSPVLSIPGRIRALADLVIPGAPVEDETLASFVERRLGRELLDRLAQPLVAGIYGAHPDVLGLAATVPRFLEAERTHGSVIRGLRARGPSAGASGARYGLFINFDRGMQTLTDAMHSLVEPFVRLGATVRSIRRGSGGFELDVDGSIEKADGVVVAAAARPSARLVADLDPRLAASIEGVRQGSGAIVTFAYPRDRIEHPLDAYGYVTPIVEGRRVSASTFLSRKWPGRSPAGIELVRFFVGRDGDDAVVDLDDASLVAIARDEAETMLGARGEPLLVRIDRWRDAMPRFGLHHLRTVEDIEARVAAIPRLGLAGNSFRGVGIPDSIASGEAAADRAIG